MQRYPTPLQVTHVLGKRYDEGGGRESVVKFETVRPLAKGNPPL